LIEANSVGHKGCILLLLLFQDSVEGLAEVGIQLLDLGYQNVLRGGQANDQGKKIKQ